jgi:hypothetical protein
MLRNGIYMSNVLVHVLSLTSGIDSYYIHCVVLSTLSTYT